MGSSCACSSINVSQPIPQSQIERANITKQVSLVDQKRSVMPSQLYQIESNLHILDISDNQFEIIDFTQALSQLKTLKANNNPLSMIVDTIVDFKNLEILSLNQCQFNAIPLCVLQMPKLKNLSMQSNQISQFIATSNDANPNATDIDFDSIDDIDSQNLKFGKKLKILNLSSNQLQVIPELFCLLQNLVECNLEQNCIEKLPTKHWKKMTKLTLLNLRNNRLKDISATLFTDTNVNRITLDDNPVYTSQKYIHLDGFDTYADRHKATFEKGLGTGVSRGQHLL